MRSRDRLKQSLTLIFVAIAATVVLSGCVDKVKASRGCHLFGEKIRPDDGFETRWTRNEKVQVNRLNQKVEKFCR